MKRLCASVLLAIFPVACDNESHIVSLGSGDTGLESAGREVVPEVIFVYRTESGLRFAVDGTDLDIDLFDDHLRDVLAEDRDREFEMLFHTSVTDGSFVEAGENERAIRYGDYTITFGLKRSHVAGCISRVAWNVAFRVNYQSLQLTDIHVAGWMADGRFCYGVYQSVSPRWSTCSCSATRREIARDITTALVGVGIGYGIAVVLADAMSYVVIGAMAVVATPIPP